jgi:lysozyme family protein
MSNMDDGFFPLGVNGFPHGGVHFGNASKPALDQAGGVRCIADGEIVAHKIDDAYPHLQFSDGKWAAYSTGFVLVRHSLTMPPGPDSRGPQPADESHHIYSLYMHMADWVTYLADVQRPRPFWWDVDAYSVSGKDRQSAAPDGRAGATGAFVWTEPMARKKKGQYNTGQQVGFLPQGCEVIVGEKRGQWGHIQSITEGGMISPTSGGEFGLDDASVPWKASHERTVARAAVTPEGDWGWVLLPGLQATKEPKKIGQVVTPNPPIHVKAGTSLGQLGEYQDYERANHLPPTPRRSLLHLEVFADDSFSAFLTKSRQRAAELPAGQKTHLVIAVGARLVQSVASADRKLGEHDPVAKVTPTEDSPASGPWVKVQARYENQGLLIPEGAPLWIKRDTLASAVTGTPAWSRFPLQLQSVDDPASGFQMIYSRAQLDALDERSKAVDDQKVSWWRVTGFTADGKNTLGWVCGTAHPGTTWQSPWAWPGFDIVDATGINLADAFKRNLVITDAADWKEKNAFEPSAVAVNNSPLLLKLEQTVAKQNLGPDNANNGKVTARAIQAAMKVPALAQALSHVILRYESEWGGNMARWDAITPIMRNAKANWLKELERVKKLQWRDDVKGKVPGFPVSATVLHINPVALVGNFYASVSSCAVKFEKISAIILRHEGGYVNNANDRGGATNKGISWAIWQAYAQSDAGVEPTLDNLKNITNEQAKKIYLNRFWEPRGFCKIHNSKTALMIYDWTITSGGAVKEVRKVLNKNFNETLAINSTMDQAMIDAINDIDNQASLLDKIGKSRKAYYTHLPASSPSQLQFLTGWLNRVDDCLAVAI